ncbi:MAG: TIGR04283 family arsenosugar biosynthesis glycosyltransferase [Proteobacteria bacterium]|nr:TIGR04283 family arsenosugar biosynthesis glycosyltransferase [Pseudomonadota bacterium]
MEKIKFSIIVPVLHESDTINSLIEHLDRLEYDAGHEIIVADGSPDRDTIQAIGRKSVIKIVAPKGRARQMNAGASMAKGEILIFLHADTKLPRDALTKIASAMAQNHYVGGAFELDIKSERFRFKLLSRWASIRCHLTRIPYGDQAIFIKRDYFNTIGGYRDIPLMEDVELMRRIKRRGDKICILRDRVMTSPRRWEQEGFVYVNLRNAALFIMYLLGVSPEKLASFYKDTYR